MDVEKTMQFILEHQAAHAAAISVIEEKIVVIENNLDRVVGVLERVVEAQAGDRARMDHLDAKFAALSDKVAAVSDKVDQTTENMNALIRVVDSMLGRGPKQ